jgi:hypothetical protein
MMTPPPQRLRALERANAVRLARAELKRRIAEGGVSAADIILNPPHAARSWAIGDLLMSQRRWGGTRCRKFLLRNQISETKQVGALTERQRRLLATQLGSCETRQRGPRGERAPELLTPQLDRRVSVGLELAPRELELVHA